MPKFENTDLYGRGLVDWDDIETSLAEIWPRVTTGWGPLILKALSGIRALAPELPCQPVIIDIKEKYGGLRIYYHPFDERIDAVIAQAEEEAAETCIQCGRRERASGHWYLSALCPACLRERFPSAGSRD